MRPYLEPRIYQHEQLMHELNELAIAIKAHLLPIEQLKHKYPKPTCEEIDEVTTRVMHALRQDSKPMIMR